MLFGAHVSIAEGLEKAPLNASKIKCECFQIFDRPPQGGKAPKLTLKVIRKFKKACQRYGLAEYYVHAPYFINLASSLSRIFYGSIDVITEELERASLLGAKYFMTHIGSAKDLGEKQSLEKAARGVKEICKKGPFKTKLLLENSAGSGKIIGDSFEELAWILKKAGGKDLGICLDTAHAFESGYDLRNKKTIDRTLVEFDKKIGLRRLKLIHANDSKTPLFSHHDRHEHIGRGEIGLKGFYALVHHSKLKNINMIIETPKGEDGKNIQVLKELRDKKIT